MGIYIVPELESLGHCGSLSDNYRMCGNVAKFYD